MSGQIQFYEKSKLDLSNASASITVTDAVATNTGESFVDYVRNRKNTSAWLTTGSTDVAGTTLDITLGGDFDIDTIILIGHNFKSYTIQYFDGATYSDFSTPISETTNAESSTRHTFTSVQANLIRLVINSTQTVDADKILKQLIVTESIGTLQSWPEIKKPRHSTNKRKNQMLSGKINLVESVGSFSATLAIKSCRNSADLDIFETIWFRKEGVLMQLNGFDEAQFSSLRIGYRNEDLYLIKPINDYTPSFVDSVYQAGIALELQIQESIE